VAVITNIALDHTEFAGPRLADIASEKAGIIKPGSAVVVGETDPDLVDIFRAEGGASYFVRGEGFDVDDNSLAVGGRSVDLRTPTTIYPDVFVPLHGAHQGDNAAVALTAVEAFFAAPLEQEIVHEGFANVEMPGRFEVLGVQPLAIIDGAHNPPGADVCAGVFFDDFQPDGRRILVVGTLRDPGEMLEALRADEFDVVHACTAPSPRGVPARQVAAAARQLGCDEVYVHDTVEAACAAAMRSADADDAILAAGSIYVAGAARPALRHYAN
jgi:dihydrofolate synthase/folylpolyglutamate synthase